jgi:hypothetical protein
MPDSWNLSGFSGSSLRAEAEVFDGKNRTFTICAYACQAEALSEGEYGC